MDNYLFQAAPKPVSTRTQGKGSIYRQREAEEKESFTKTQQQNIMHDRRVARGSTYAPSKRTQPLNNGPFRPIPIQQPANHPSSHHNRTHHRTSIQPQHPLPPSSAAPQHDDVEVDFMRVATPEPVAGRSHATIQTDTYLEDLRRNKQTQEHDFATQTDPENDRPTQPLFIPRSSGEDVATEIEPDALFDFELEVESLLNVLVEKTLEQSLMEVCEEEELAELAHHQASYQQHKNAELIGVQQIIERDERRQAERERRMKQEADRLEEERKTAQKRQAATIAKRMVQGMEEKIIQKLETQDAFYDPVRKEVETLFMPHLMRQTSEKLQAYAEATRLLDGVLRETIRDYSSTIDRVAGETVERQVELYQQHFLDPTTHPRPIEPILASAARFGIEDERSARVGIHGAESELAKSSLASSSSSSSSAEVRARAIVDRILAERAAAEAAEAKRLHDIRVIQSLARGKRDRKRVAILQAKRRKEAERAAMSPQELLASLPATIGMQLKLIPPTDILAEADQADVRVIRIDPRGSAAQAGLVVGDRILTLNGVEVFGPDDFSVDGLKRASLHPSDIVTLEVQRLTTDERREKVLLELTTDEEGFPHDRLREIRADADLPPSQVAWLSKSEAVDALHKLPGKLGATPVEQTGGAKLTKVGEGSAAARAGLKDGDIVVALKRQPVTDYKAFTAACKESHAGDILELEVLTPESLAKVANGAPIVRSMPTRKVLIEMGGGGKKYSVEAVRGLRRVAGLTVFGEQKD